jgi:hypothetical protein
MSDSRLSQFDERLRRRIEQFREKRAKTSRGLLGESPTLPERVPDFSGMPIHEAAAAYDSWMTARIRKHCGETTPERPTLSAEDREQPVDREMSRVSSLDRLDRVMEDDFGLRRFLPDSAPRTATTLCTTRQEFLEPICDYLGTSRGVADRWLETVEREQAADQASPLTRTAVHITGQGCLVNGWKLARRHDLSSPSEALKDEAAFREAARSIGEEKWGCGFITRYTAYGAEKLQRGLCRWDLAARLGVEIHGDSKSRQLAERLRSVSCLTEEGWSSWVGEYLAWRSDPVGAELGVRTGFRLAQLVDGIEHVVGIVPWELVSGLLEAIRWIFLQTEIGPSLIHESTRRLQKLYAGDDPRICRLRSQIARMLMGKLEARLGVLPLPYAMILAGNVTYDLTKSSAGRIAERARRYPRQNLDSRVAMLSFLDPMVKYDVSTTVSAAWHEFELEPPSTLQWT